MREMSLMFQLALLRVSSDERAITFVANLYTSRPFMWMKCSPSRTVRALAGWALPPAGTDKRSPPEPSERKTDEITPPGSSLACNTKAPAPSPNRIHVSRSVQSRNLDRVSAPITKAVLIAPLRIVCVTISNA